MLIVKIEYYGMKVHFLFFMKKVTVFQEIVIFVV